MKYHNITKDDMINGEGLRVVLWVSGCEHHCPGCHNPCTWDINSGLDFTEDTKAELFKELEKPHIDGITLSGGDPLHTANRKDISELIDEIKEKYPQKTIWLYTGDEFEDICTLPLLRGLDVIVTGEYIADLRDEKYEWAGSTNQKVIRLREDISNMVQLDEGKFESFLRIIYPNYDAMKAVALQEIEKGDVIVNEEGKILYKDEYISLPKYIDRKYLQIKYSINDNYFASAGRIVRELATT